MIKGETFVRQMLWRSLLTFPILFFPFLFNNFLSFLFLSFPFSFNLILPIWLESSQFTTIQALKINDIKKKVTINEWTWKVVIIANAIIIEAKTWLSKCFSCELSYRWFPRSLSIRKPNSYLSTVETLHW